MTNYGHPELPLTWVFFLSDPCNVLCRWASEESGGTNSCAIQIRGKLMASSWRPGLVSKEHHWRLLCFRITKPCWLYWVALLVLCAVRSYVKNVISPCLLNVLFEYQLETSPRRLGNIARPGYSFCCFSPATQYLVLIWVSEVLGLTWPF